MTSEDTVVQEDGFGFVPREFGADDSAKNSFGIVRRYTLTNKSGGSVRLISWGAGVQSIRIPNSRGFCGDVVLGFDDMQGYLKNRYIGRIIDGAADIGSLTGTRDCSDLENRTSETRGSREKFHDYDNVNWESHVSGHQVIMSYVSAGGDRESRGNMLIHVKYNWNDRSELNATINATVTESSPANFTLFCPMNLAGHATGAKELYNHIATVNSDQIIPMNPGQRWFNRIARVDANFYDLRNSTRLKNRLGKIAGGGYNHTMRINSPSNWCYRFHGRMLHPESGRFLEVYSDKANLRFSTLNDFPAARKAHVIEDPNVGWAGGENYFEGQTNPVEESRMQERPEVRGKDGALYGRHSGFVFSPRNNSGGRSIRENCLLYPGEVFAHDLSYKFGVKSRHD